MESGRSPLETMDQPEPPTRCTSARDPTVKMTASLAQSLPQMARMARTNKLDRISAGPFDGSGATGGNDSSVDRSRPPVARNFSIGGLPDLIGNEENQESLAAGRRQIRQKKTHDSVLVTPLFIVQHPGIISTREDSEFVRGRGKAKQVGGGGCELRLVARFEIKLRHSGKLRDSRS